MKISIGNTAHLLSILAENHKSIKSVIGLVSVVDTFVGVKISVVSLAINYTANFQNALYEQ
jgi:hypothetical protein